MTPQQKNRFLILVSLIFLNIGVWWNVISSVSYSAFPTQMHFLDVGQGDSALIRTRAGNVLIDAGKKHMGVIRELDSILPISDRIIDVLVISHPQLDHLGGFAEVIKRYDVRAVLLSGVSYPLRQYMELLQLIQSKNIPVVYAMKGGKIFAGDARFLILHPTSLLAGKTATSKNVNDTSIVMRFDAGGVSALFTGDITGYIEKQIADIAGQINVLKVSHHGSKYSSDEIFLRKIRPNIAVIGVGKNSYGHPAPEALHRLSEVGARVFRTDLDGSVSLIVEDGAVKIKSTK